MERQVARGRIVPCRVFSRQISRVGAKWMSGERIAEAWMSGRVRCVFGSFGVVGIARAEDRRARPPASLKRREKGGV